MKLTETRVVVAEVIYEISSDPIKLYKLGCGKIEISDNALEEILDHTYEAKLLIKGISEKNYFVKLLKNVILEKK